jgi:hypothetical protein
LNKEIISRIVEENENKPKEAKIKNKDLFFRWCQILCNSVSQPVCRGTPVCREILPSVPQIFLTSLLLFFCGK